MTYELAKELKDAGFPQEPSGEVNELFGDTRHSEYILWKDDACSPTVIAGTEDYKKGIERGDNLVKLPTLSELIEACGERFGSVTRSPRGTWYATRVDVSVELVVGDEYGNPKEAVAKFWLALKK